jgi:F-type H+-transporting ATPase subunit a
LVWWQELLIFGLSAGCAAGCFLLQKKWGQTLAAIPSPTKKQRRKKTYARVGMIVAAWVFLAHLSSLLFRAKEERATAGFSISIFPERVEILGIHVSETVLISWGILLAVFIFALVTRLTLLRHMRQEPKGLQAVLEICVEGIDKYIGEKTGNLGTAFGGYILSLALFLLASAFTELFHLHAPTADITQTLALSLITFAMINYYGFKVRGGVGRVRTILGFARPPIPENASFAVKLGLYLKAAMKPTLVVVPFRILSDLIVPVSLACRLFGNMFAGMVIMDLIYYALGRFAIGLPGLAGLFFNLFHPLIQGFIFITLTLSYIEESTAPDEAA